MSQALVFRFRSRWLESPLPMIVEHRPGVPESICAAPSLWMGGKLVAERLRAQGIGPGHRVRYQGPPGAVFVQALVGTLRAGAAFHAEDLGPEGLPAHAVVHADLSLEIPPERPAEGDATARLIARTAAGGPVVVLGEAELEARAAEGVSLLGLLGAAKGDDTALRIGCAGGWSDWRLVVVEVLGALLHEAELHLGTCDVPRAQLDAIGSLPHLRVARVDGDPARPLVLVPLPDEALAEAGAPAVHEREA